MKTKPNSTPKNLVTMWPYALAAAVVSTGLTTPVALAQETTGLEEIIVTATKREVNIPVSYTHLTLPTKRIV